MLPYWNLGGTLFPTYSLLTLLGAAAAWLYFHRQLKARGENPGRTEQAFLFGVLGALVGAKFLYLLLQLPQLLQDLPLLAADPAAFSARYLSGGFVFYGGLFGALAAVWLFCRRRKVPFSQLGADLVPAVPLFHTFGRVGCFLAGCCYGIPAPAGWPGVTFRVSPVAPNGVALLPVQLYEAAGCSFFCCTAWPGGAGRGRPFCWSIWPPTPCSASPWNFFGAMPPGGCGGYFPPLSCWLWLLWPLSSPS